MLARPLSRSSELPGLLLSRILMAALCLMPLAAQCEPAALDLVLSGGTVHDGTGAEPFRADVGVRDGRIALLGDLRGHPATHRIDVTGHVVAPGFIDTHAHADAMILRRPTADNFLHMGVTTIITGNCGNSMANLRTHLASVGKRRVSLNYGSLIGHNTVRRAVLGTANRAPTDAELAAMQAHVRRAMQAGAMGLSTGLIYVPGTYATTAEITALAQQVAPFGGVYASHMRNENDRVLQAIDEALRIGARAGVAVHLSHLKASGKPNWGRSAQIVARLRRARARGARVTGDQYAYAASSTGLDVLFPTAALSIGRPGFAKKLVEDPAFRREMHAALLQKMDKTGFGDLAWCMVSYARGHQEAAGKSIADCAEQFFGSRSRDAQARAAIKLFADTEGKARVTMVFKSMNEDDVKRIMREPFVSVACDAGVRAKNGTSRPHPRGAGNNARVLGYFVREQRVLPLALAVHKMTGLPAKVFQLRDRGLVRIGYHADLTVFDPQTVAAGATYEEPRKPPRGLPYVFVNGVVVIEKGVHNGNRPGHVLYHRTERTK